MLTDNTVTEYAIRNGKSRDRRVNKEWSKIQDLLIEDHSNIEVRRVSSEDNAADLLSRGFDSSKHVLNEVKLQLPDDLREFLTHRNQRSTER
jgi:hypothetical protein